MYDCQSMHPCTNLSQDSPSPHHLTPPPHNPDRETSPQQNPLLTRVEVKAGHGAGKPTAKVIAEIADMYGFAAAIIGADWVADESAA